MANKREFKKVVDLLGAELCNNMMIAWVNVEGADKKAISDAIGKVVDGVEAARHHSNIHFDRGMKGFESLEAYSKAKKAFYKALFNKTVADFNQVVSDALKQFNAALPQSEKDANKAAVNS